MTNKISILFWFRKSSNAKIGKGTIMLRVTLNSERVEYGSTGVMCEKEEWDIESQRVKSKTNQALNSNNILSSIHQELMNLYFNFEAKRTRITANKFKAIYKGASGLNPSFEFVFEKFFAERGDLTKTTIVSYGSKCKNFTKFCEYEKNSLIRVEDITPKLMNRLYTYMLNNNFSRSYAGKAKQVIKTILTWAYEHEYIANNPLADYTVKIDRKVNTECLTIDELQQIMSYSFPLPLQSIADCFIFCCQTGLEFAGIEKLDFAKSLVLKGERLCLKDERLKTGIERFVPLNEVALKLIDKYRDKNKFPMSCNAHVNRELKEVARLAGINKRLYWHIARKTFADHCLNERNMSMEATMKAMGQSNLNSIKPYAKVDERRVLSEFVNF